ncbi:MAG: iron-sulfur cluster assembly scaffold protein [Puniceicoccaceae bacterium]
MNDFIGSFRDLLLRHFRSPEGDPLPDGAGWGEVEKRNRTCGDRVGFSAILEGDRVERLLYRVEGCAVTTGLASIVSKGARGKEVETMLAQLGELADGLRSEGESEPMPSPDPYGELGAALAVRDLPSRRNCALIVLEASREALRQAQR